MAGITTDSFNSKRLSKGPRLEKDTTIEDFFRDFWPTVDEEVKKERGELALKEEAEKRKKLEQELSALSEEETEKKKNSNKNY